MKKGMLVLTAIIFNVVCGFSVLSAEDLPENIEMKSPVFEEHTRAIVTLSHTKHAKEYKIACSECHHMYKDGKNVW
jgi:hypothetical protein